MEICPTQLFFTINTIYNVYMYMVLMTLLPFFFLLVLNAFIVVKKSMEGSSAQKPVSPSMVVKSNGRRTSLSVENHNDHFNNALPLPSPHGIEADVYPFARGCGSKRAASEENPWKSASDHTLHRRAKKRESLDSIMRDLRNEARRKMRRVSMTLSLHGVSIQTSSSTTDDTIVMIMVVVLFLSCNTLALIVNLIETFFEPDGKC